ncbi:MAG: rod shape-determining protein MreD [Chloroflexia bacterium]
MRTVCLLALVLFALLQATAMPRLPLLGVRPDLVLVGVLAWTIVRGLHEGAIGAFVGGIAMDLLSPSWLGSHTLALLLVTVAVGALAIPLHRGNLAFPVAAALLGTVGYNLLLMALTGVLARSGGLELAARVVLPLMLVHGALMPATYAACEWLDQRIRPRIRIG